MGPSKASRSEFNDEANATAFKPDQRPAHRIDPQNVLLFLIAIRLANALTVRTFFQPDEYFQALEPAWQWAFGPGAGAWITWEWKHHLRSAIHPAIFGICYQLANSLAGRLGLGSHATAEILLNAPKLLQAVFAAMGDFYTWKLALNTYGTRSLAALCTLLLSIVSPWQWFCSTRTFSNSLETTLTIIALYNWPWHWAPLLKADTAGQRGGVRVRDKPSPKGKTTDELSRLRRSLLCAAVAVILRPTNILIWIVLSWYTVIGNRGAPSQKFWMFAREAVLCGSTILLSSAITDRLFFSAWVFPPVNFLRVNVFQSLASFYGNNDWHYYISQGYPLLLTTALPFAVIGLRRTLGSSQEGFIAETTYTGQNTLRLLARISIFVPAAFSLISHKEVRFIYPLLPALHILSGLPISKFFQSLLSRNSPSQPTSMLTKRLLLLFILSLNISIAFYLTQIHNSGLIQLTHYLRSEFETHYLPSSTPQNMTFGALMPCHSTPWRSHIQYPPTLSHSGIQGWALTCEPPLNLNTTEKASYLDEADQFYENPSLWIKKHVSRSIPPSPTSPAPSTPPYGKITTIPASILDLERAQQFWSTGTGRKPWPEYLIFFAQLEPAVQSVLGGNKSGYAECHRLFNSHFHDDWRRTGDVVVWCLDTGRQEEWARTMKNKAGRRASTTGDGFRSGRTVLEEGAASQKILGGAKGGMKEHPREVKEPLRRVVEKPFWKARDPEPGPDQ